MINLLPPQQKEELLQEQRYRLYLILGALVMVFLIALSLVLFAVKTYISGKVESLTIILPPQLHDSEEEIFVINKNLQSLDLFYAGQPGFAVILEKISKIIPAGINPASIVLSFSKKSGNFSASLQGFSLTREFLFQLKKNLESDQIFKDINFPPSNWVKPENIEFTATFKVEP